MTLQLKTDRVEFDNTADKVQREPGSVTFRGDVRTAGVALTGFQLKYPGTGEHPVNEIRIRIDPQGLTASRTVNYEIEFLIRDGSGHIDDAFGGWVDVLIIADVAD